MAGLICRIKEYIQPFERRLALAELRALVKEPVLPLDGNEATASIFAVSDRSDADMLRSALAYWHSVDTSDVPEPEALTVQLGGEATSLAAQGDSELGVLFGNRPAWTPSKLPRRRCLRYATHGLHEHRGKFFPQLVRSLMNIAQVPAGGIVLDPMCGSGTTTVEARLAGRVACGLDMNPLSVFVARVKCRALTLTPSLQRGDVSRFGEIQFETQRCLVIAEQPSLRKVAGTDDDVGGGRGLEQIYLRMERMRQTDVEDDYGAVWRYAAQQIAQAFVRRTAVVDADEHLHPGDLGEGC